MLRQLHITKLRPGPSGSAAPVVPNAANCDPAQANPYPDWPDVLTSRPKAPASLARLADGKSIRFLNVNDKLADARGTLLEGMTVDGLHPSLKGYRSGPTA